MSSTASPVSAAAASPPPTPAQLLEKGISELIGERHAYIGKNVALNYSKMPLYIVRGKGQFLYDEAGNEYLDCVNNVCHVGHCHPHVAEAGASQMAMLNTNSR